MTSRFKRRDILESILWPSKIISDQYQAEMLELTDGSVVTGMLVRENATALLVRTGETPDKPVVVTKARVANRVTSAISLMPEGLVDSLTHDEITNSPGIRERTGAREVTATVARCETVRLPRRPPWLAREGLFRWLYR